MKNEKELYDLRDDLKNATTGNEFVEIAWESSIKNAMAINYISGVVDALYYAGRLTQEEYTFWYKVLYQPRRQS